MKRQNLLGAPHRWLTLLAVSAAALSLSAQDDWQWVSPTPTGMIPDDIAYGDGVYLLAAGQQLQHSTDGVHWTAHTVPDDNWPTQVVFNGDHFVAAGMNFTAIVSPAGDIGAIHPVEVKFHGLRAGNGALVALDGWAGTATALQVSHDETTWDRQALPEGFASSEIAFGNGVFVVLGRDGTVLRSTDATTWQRVTVDTSTSNDDLAWIASNGTRFVARWAHGHGFFYSDDGLTWTATTVNPPLGTWTSRTTLGGADGHFYFDSGPQGKGVFLSADGETWETLYPMDEGSTTYDVYPINFEHLAGGDGFVIGLAHLYQRNIANPSFYVVSGTLNDGHTWNALSQTPLQPGQTGNLVRGLGRYFLNGQSSPDGLMWINTGFSPTHAAGERLFRISAIDSQGRDTGPLVSTSTANFTVQVSVSRDGQTSSIVDPAMAVARAVTYGADRYVIVGDGGQISTSTDGATWTAATSGVDTALYAVTYAFGEFIAGGAANTLLTSPDGLTWTAHATPNLLGARITCLGAGPDRLVVGSSHLGTGSDTSLLTMTLLGHDVVFPRDHIVQSVAWLADHFVAASTSLPIDASNYQNASNQLIESSDGVTWSKATTSTYGLMVGEAPAQLAVSPTGALYTTRTGTSQYPTSTTTALLRRQVIDDAPVTITHGPAAQTVAQGESAVFAVGADGSGPFTYQWLHDGQPVANATAAILRLSDIVDNDGGDYTVQITNAVGTTTSSAATLTVTAPVALDITQQPIGGSFSANTEFKLAVTVTGSGPITYQWRRDGVAISGATSATYSIWAPAYASANYAGAYDVVVTAPYSTVTSEAVNVTWAGPQITLTSGDRITVPAGGAFTAGVSVTGNGPFNYVWSRTRGGLTVPTNQPTLSLTTVSTDDSGPYHVTVTDAAGESTQLYFTVQVVSANATPVVTPVSVTTALGRNAQLTATYAAGDQTVLYQWYRDGQLIVGATDATFNVPDVQPGDLTQYTVSVLDGSDTYYSAPIELRLRDARLVNLSARGRSGTGDDTFSVGFVLAGQPTDADGPVLVRGIGPTLGDFQVSEVLPNPRLELKAHDGTVLAANDDWNSVTTGTDGVSAGRATFLRYGAFALADDSQDSALAVPHPAPAPYTAPVTSVETSTGVVLTEIYADPTGRQRLTNLSVRARTGPGDATLSAGFVITGTEPLRLMIRGLGPALADFGVQDVLINPRVLLFDAQGQEIGNNDTWNEGEFAADIRGLETTTGAFALPADSNDAVLVVTLAPGLYSAQIEGIGDPTGVAMIELYELP